MPIERGRTLLALGRVRRRLRERRAAKRVLEQALAIFESAGSALWAAQAREELGALGLRAGPRDVLTASEERVARLAASGLTNRQVASTLQISPRTVEAHLAHAYRKLDIRSRAELGARIAGRRLIVAPDPN
jgi:DNA-binding CsgD family transcriptional regulator